MEFEYFFLVQDALGVITAVFSARVLWFFLMCLAKKGFRWHYVWIMANYTLLLAAGLVLVIRPCAPETWGLFLLCAGIFYGVQRRINSRP